MHGKLHPFLIPGSWLLEGDYIPFQGAQQRVSGTTVVAAHEEYPEALKVTGEVRDEANPKYRPVSTSYTLELVAPGRVRFHMDSVTLGTVLLGSGVWTSELLFFYYASPDKRIVGNETYTACSEDFAYATGFLSVDGVAVTCWLASLQRID